MCGRFTLTCPGEELARIFGLATHLDQPPRYNIAPTQRIVALLPVGPEGRLEAVCLRWGLQPPWARAPLINARAESVASRPAFARAFSQRRCLIPADGFLEWRREGKQKQPFHIRFRDRRPFAMAGLWEPALPGEETGRAAIVTTAPNDLVAPLHDRMPMILERTTLEAWLAPQPPGPEALQALARPFPAEAMEAIAVSRKVNDARHEGPDCLEPIGAPR